jgi:hypothetical protein
MPIASDFTLDYTNRIVTHTSGTTRYTVNELYSLLMDLFDDSANMDDKVAMSAQTPNEYALINGWFIPDATYDYLYEGAIRTIGLDAATYTDGVYRMTHQAGGYTNCVSGDIGKTVTDGTRSGVLLGYDNTTREWYVRRGTATAWSGACTITSGTGAGTITGSVLTGEDVWANFYTLGTIESGSIIYWYQNGSLVAALGGTSYTYSSGHADQLIRTKKNGTAIDSSAVTAFCRNLGNSYDNFTATATATGGRNPVPLATSPDTNDDSGTASDLGVTVSFGSYSKDIGDGAGVQPYKVLIDGNGLTAAQVYKALKYVTRRQASAGTFTTTGSFYRYADAAYAEKKAASFGLFAGSTFFGAQGVWLENISDVNNRSLLDNNNVVRTPPVSLTFTVTAVVSGDRVLVARSTGSGSVTINKSQFTLNGSHTSGGGSVVVNETVGTDIPDTGVLRIDDTRYPYTSVNRGTKTFTLTGTLATTYATATPTYVPLIDDTASGTSIVSPSMIYAADFDVVYRVRKKGIIPFENSALVGSSGASVAAIRTTDTIVT